VHLTAELSGMAGAKKRQLLKRGTFRSNGSSAERQRSRTDVGSTPLRRSASERSGLAERMS